MRHWLLRLNPLKEPLHQGAAEDGSVSKLIITAGNGCYKHLHVGMTAPCITSIVERKALTRQHMTEGQGASTGIPNTGETHQSLKRKRTGRQL